MRNAHRRLLLFACAILFSTTPLLAQSHRWPMSPCDIHGVCSFKDIVSHYGFTSLTLVDDTSHIFIVAYVNPGVIFKRQDGTKVKSKPGSPEEQCLLAVLKQSYAAAYPTPLAKEPPSDGTEKKKFWNQYAIHHLIEIFQQRCVTMQEENLRNQ